MNPTRRACLLCISALIVLLTMDGALAGGGYGRGRGQRRHGAPVAALTVPPADNPEYRETCGQCHFIYQPGLLPEASWARLVAGCSNHFGNDLGLDPSVVDSITTYLTANAAGSAPGDLSAQIARCVGSDVPSRVTDVPKIRRVHTGIAAHVFDRASVGGRGNCAACHPGAESGVYSRNSARIPQP